MRRLFDGLVPHVTPDIEIVVRDDSTNNETHALIDEYAKRTPIRYFHLERGGLDRAVISLTQEAKGTFVWWLGNEDVTTSGVAEILGVLTKNPDLDFLFVNSEGETGERAVRAKESRFLRDKNETIEVFADLLGFISATIFRREHALSGLRPAEQYIGTAWVNLYIILHVLSRSSRIYYLATPCFASDPKPANQPTWYDPYQVFAINFARIVRAFNGKFAVRSIRGMLAKNFDSVWRTTLVYRARGYQNGFGSSHAHVRDLFPFYSSFPVFWLALPLLILPRYLVRFLYRAYKIVVPGTRIRF